MESRLKHALLWLRYSVFLVMFMWTMDKFFRPGHAAGVFKTVYGLGGLNQTPIYVIGTVELIILVGFLFGILKTYTYGLVLVFHGISTISSYAQYLDPYASKVNLLFFAAWPMLAACATLFYLRNLDTKWTFGDEERS